MENTVFLQKLTRFFVDYGDIFFLYEIGGVENKEKEFFYFSCDADDLSILYFECFE